MRDAQRTSTLVCSSTALAIWLVFVVLDALRLDLTTALLSGHVDVLAVVILRALTLVTLVASISQLAGAWATVSYHRLSSLCLAMIGLSATVSVNVYKSRGLPHADLAQFAIVIAVFLPVGMTFVHSLATASAIAFAVALAGVLMLAPDQMGEHYRLTALLCFAAFVGGVGAYLRESAHRDQFLARRLLHELAMTDALTGVANRRAFEIQGQEVLAQARISGRPVMLAILDVDHFKRFNDEYGHQAGDDALRRIAKAISARLNTPRDFVVRLGGEEFGIVLQNMGIAEARRALAEVSRCVSALEIAHSASETSDRVTVSIGAAYFDGRETIESLYRRADATLYRSKAAGRNQFKVDDARIVHQRGKEGSGSLSTAGATAAGSATRSR